jgi:hypothetical protein
MSFRSSFSFLLGAYPLSFAAAIDNGVGEELVDLLINNPHAGEPKENYAEMEKRDEYGNTALHVLVIKVRLMLYTRETHKI